MASKFASAFMQAKNPEVTAMAEEAVTTGSIGTATCPEDVTMGSDLPGKTKATEKCQVKSSTREQSDPVDNSCGEAAAPALVTKAGSVASHQPEEMEATTDVTMVIGGCNTSKKLLMDTQMLNQEREMVFCLLNQSKILNECWVQVV